MSFEEIIKYQQKTKLEMTLAQLDFTNILNFLYSKSATRRPKGRNPLYSLIAMQLEQIKRIKKLVARLETDPVFRYTCSFNILDRAPPASTFSRFLSKISKSNELERDFESFVLKAKTFALLNCIILVAGIIAVNQSNDIKKVAKNIQIIKMLFLKKYIFTGVMKFLWNDLQ